MRLQTLSIFAILAATAFAAVAPRAAAREDNVIVAYVTPNEIAVESGTPEIASLARRAFAAHGGYKLGGASATRSLRLTKAGANAVSFVFRDSKGTRGNSVSGATLADAVLRACDAALVIDKQRPLFAAKIAFVSDRTGKKEIYAGDLFFDTVRQLTNYRSISVTPRWTFDGSEVLHTTYANRNFTDIYAVNAVSGARRGVIVGKRGTATGAVSNPKTGQVAFASSGLGDMDIFLANADGKGIRVLFGTKGEVETDPAWSPDGERLAVTSGATGRPGIHIVNKSGGAARRVSTGFGYSTEPSWNPVFKNKIAFTYNKSGVFKIGVVDIASGQVEPLATAGNHRYSNPVWCADGRHILATRVSGVTSRLVLIDADPRQKQVKETVLSGAQMANCSDADYFLAR
ncbi:MAG: hypothetical protein LBT53_04760 [Puniceicoccales bacterium]|jgi:TolB protein|nr:hypothetical protein [Puniceicoccales bacterium]